MPAGEAVGAQNQLRTWGQRFKRLHDPVWVRTISTLLDSEAWDLTLARSYEEAIRASGPGRIPWCCIIADVDLNSPEGRTGIDVLAHFLHAPFISGQRMVERQEAVQEMG